MGREAPAGQAEGGPIRGVGIGLRLPHLAELAARPGVVPWLELLVDNWLWLAPPALGRLQRLRADYPMTFHGVGLNLGGSDPLDRDYLHRLRRRMDELAPAWISDHLCWTRYGRHCLHDLLPLPATPERVRHVADRVSAVQDILGTRILVENVSSYLRYVDDAMPEWAFVTEVVERADCELLLDVNNIHVSACNHGFDARRYLDAVPPARVREMHLAGYEVQDDCLLDTHGAPVHPPVWDLFRHALARFGETPVLVEWDTDLPPLAVLLAEAAKAEAIRAECRHAVA